MADRRLTDDELRRLIAKVVTAKKAKGPSASLDSYVGNLYFVSDWVDDNTLFEKAVVEVQEPLALCLMLEIFGLEYVLADKHATAGLRKRLLENNRLVRLALGTYAAQMKPKGKPGPRPKNGKFIGALILELDQQGYTNRKIAEIVYGDPLMTNKVSAHLAQVRKKLKKQHGAGSLPQ